MSKLSEAIIKQEVPPEKGQRFIFDDHRDAPRGFGLRITAAGGKAFILRYTFDGVARRKTIGSWPTWSLSAAREEAGRLKRLIDSGIDVLAEARQRRTEPTVADLVDEYCQAHVDALKSGAAVRSYFDRDVIPVIGKMKVRDVRRRDVIELVEAKGADKPTAARHLLTYVRGMLEWAADREYIEFNPAAGLKPKAIKPKGRRDALKPTARGRVLDDTEIQTFWNNAENCSLHLLTALALKLILVTGQRPGEVAGMAHSEIRGDVWTIPAARRGKDQADHDVPLTETALQLVEAAKEEVDRLSARRTWKAGDHVFAARPNGGLTINALDRAVKRRLAELGNTAHSTWGHWTPHDLRRTCRTGLSAAGIGPEIAERVIGHSVKGIEAVYNHHTYIKEKRTALEAWEQRLIGIVDGSTESGKVISILATGGTKA